MNSFRTEHGNKTWTICVTTVAYYRYYPGILFPNTLRKFESQIEIKNKDPETRLFRISYKQRTL